MSATSSLPEQLLEAPVARRLHAEAFNRERAHLEYQETVQAHHVVRTEVLEELAASLRDEQTPSLLGELRTHGLLWSSVAQIVGVSDAAIRKWRRGEAIESSHRTRLCRLLALSRLYDRYAAPTAASAFGEWLATPIVPRFSATPLQILALNRDVDAHDLQPLLDWMLSYQDGARAEDLLDRYLGEGWRDEARDEQRFRIITTAAGDRLLVVDE
jgi:hypothetical protein